VTTDEAFHFARSELLGDASPIDVIGDLEVRGFSSREAEEIVEHARFDLENEHDSEGKGVRP
jgi:hypothetical protein